MRLGFGLYRHMLDAEHYRFAKQCGATDIIVHLCDYGVKGDRGADKADQPIGDDRGWGMADHPQLWTLEELLQIRSDLEAHGLRLHGIENFDPAQWHDVLLSGPLRDVQIAQIKQQLEIYAEAGVKIVGYNFSLGGVAGREILETRGGAPTVGLRGVNDFNQEPLPLGMVWNMVYDPDAPEGVLPATSQEALWQRLEVFLKEVLPVAERLGIVLAAHPDDPPLDTVRGQPRLVNRHHLYQRLLDIAPSPANQLEFCVGTLAEMPDEDLCGCIEQYAKQHKVGYVHMRNVTGKAPHYTETFIDDGDIDVQRVLEILHAHDFDGVIIPDHAPRMSCDAPWHAGMAFAMGYLAAKIATVTGSRTPSEPREAAV